MAQELATFENDLRLVEPRFVDVLAGSGVPATRVIRTILISVERNPNLLECNRQSLMNAAMSFACLQLECDGATGQGFMIPFAGKAQPVIGYKGYNTLAGRSGFTINAACVREGDQFNQTLGSTPAIVHVPILDNKGRIIGAWATATAVGRAPIVPPALGIDDLLAVKAKSPGAKKKDSPWNDPTVGFEAMCLKTAMRRLARFMPLNLLTVAAAMDEAFEERGLASRVDPDRGVVIDNEPGQAKTPETIERPHYTVIDANNKKHNAETIEQWVSRIGMILARFNSWDHVNSFSERMTSVFDKLVETHPDEVEMAKTSIHELLLRFEGDGAEGVS